MKTRDLLLVVGGIILLTIIIIAVIIINGTNGQREDITNNPPTEQPSPSELLNTTNLFDIEGTDYSFNIPEGWYSHEQPNTTVTVFTPQEEIDLQPGTEVYGLGEQISVRTGSISDDGVDSQEEWFRLNGFTNEGELFVSSDEIKTDQKLKVFSFVTEAGGADGRVQTIVYFTSEEDFIIFTHYPFNPGSDATRAFLEVINTLHQRN